MSLQKIEMNNDTYPKSIKGFKHELDVLLFTDIGMTPSSRIISTFRLARIQMQVGDINHKRK